MIEELTETARPDYPEAEAFLAASTMENSSSPVHEGSPAPLPEKPVPAGAKVIKLPEPGLLPDKQVDFLQLIELRTSQRDYGDKALTLAELSYLLWCTQGVKMPGKKNGSLRNVPSAGARHAFETYLFIQNVEGLRPGLYRFLPFEHMLYPIQRRMDDEASAAAWEQFTTDFIASFYTQKAVRESAVTFVWSAMQRRLTNQYGMRAYRYLFLDAGHVCQNLYLAAETLKFGTCALGAWSDEKINHILQLDGKEEFAVYAASVGSSKV